jgi:hypothetical protein
MMFDGCWRDMTLLDDDMNTLYAVRIALNGF